MKGVLVCYEGEPQFMVVGETKDVKPKIDVALADVKKENPDDDWTYSDVRKKLQTEGLQVIVIEEEYDPE